MLFFWHTKDTGKLLFQSHFIAKTFLLISLGWQEGHRHVWVECIYRFSIISSSLYNFYLCKLYCPNLLNFISLESIFLIFIQECLCYFFPIIFLHWYWTSFVRNMFTDHLLCDYRSKVLYCHGGASPVKK